MPLVLLESELLIYFCFFECSFIFFIECVCFPCVVLSFALYYFDFNSTRILVTFITLFSLHYFANRNVRGDGVIYLRTQHLFSHVFYKNASSSFFLSTGRNRVLLLFKWPCYSNAAFFAIYSCLPTLCCSTK